MSFASDLERFALKVETRSRALFTGCVNHVHTSIVDGSAVTGAPGQPVDTGNLRASWIQSYPEDWVGDVTTNVVYAEAIEDGVGPHGPLTLRSAVGGFHSVKTTRVNWDRVVSTQLQEIVP